MGSADLHKDVPLTSPVQTGSIRANLSSRRYLIRNSRCRASFNIHFRIDYLTKTTKERRILIRTMEVLDEKLGFILFCVVVMVGVDTCYSW